MSDIEKRDAAWERARAAVIGVLFERMPSPKGNAPLVQLLDWDDALIAEWFGMKSDQFEELCDSAMPETMRRFHYTFSNSGSGHRIRQWGFKDE